jgi:hypothetical protein
VSSKKSFFILAWAQRKKQTTLIKRWITLRFRTPLEAYLMEGSKEPGIETISE